MTAQRRCSRETKPIIATTSHDEQPTTHGEVVEDHGVTSISGTDVVPIHHNVRGTLEINAVVAFINDLAVVADPVVAQTQKSPV